MSSKKRVAKAQAKAKTKELIDQESSSDASDVITTRR
jgi:hypothetical protein